MSLLASLRASTAACHQRLEVAVNIEESVNDVREYTRILRLFYGFYLPLERSLDDARMQARLEWPLSPTSRTQWLSEDLKALGVEPSSLPLCDAPLRGEGPGWFVGANYVIEGAALGGQVIVRSIRDKGMTLPTRFFAGNGEATAMRWRSFIAWAEERDLTYEEQGPARSAAVNTFESLTAWMKNT